MQTEPNVCYHDRSEHTFKKKVVLEQNLEEHLVTTLWHGISLAACSIFFHMHWVSNYNYFLNIS